MTMLTVTESNALSRKPENFGEVGGIIMTQERLDALSAEIRTIDYEAGRGPSNLRCLDEAIERARSMFPDETAFFADGPQGLILVDTQGSTYTRYAAKVGLKPVAPARKPRKETVAQAASRNMQAIQTHLKEIGDALIDQYDATTANWADVATIALHNEQLKDVADSMLSRGEYAPGK